MLLLATLLPPLGLYLLVLGWLNRRPRPVMTAGAWDFAGLLFALSGFLLVGGPALLTALDERARLFWLLGEGEASRPTLIGNRLFWIALRILYFALVAGGAAAALRYCRRLTSVYNAEAPAVIHALAQSLDRLGLTHRRSGDCFWVGGPMTELRVEGFPLMRHVTLRWEPADAPIRRAVERELARTLAETPAPDTDSLVGWLLLLLGVTVLFLALFGAVFVLLHNLLPH